MKKYCSILFAISLLHLTGITQSATWLTDGNAGLSGTTHFLGTTDNAPIVFKVNNVMSGIIDFTYVNTAMGYRSLLYNTTGSTNTATGAYAAGGVYLLRIQNNEGWQTVKLVKQ